MLGVSRTRWGTIPLPLRLGAIGFPGCELLTSIELMAFTRTGRGGVASGYVFLDVPLPLAAKGSSLLHGQWISVVPSSRGFGGLTAAFEWRVQ